MNLGIRATLSLGLAGLLLAALAVAAAVTVGVAAADAEAQAMVQFDRRADALVALVSAQARRPEGLAELDKQLRQAADAPDLVAAGVFDGGLTVQAGVPAARHLGIGDALGGGASMVVLDREPDDPRGVGRDYRVARPVRLAGGGPAALALIFDLEPAVAAAAAGQRASLWSLAADFVLVLVFGLYVATRALVRPVRALTAAAEAIAAGSGGAEAVPGLRGPREFEGLAQSFRTMVGRLRERQSALEQTIGALERAQDELVASEKLATVGRLAAGVAHEVGNPLTAVMGYIELLREEPEGELDLRVALLGRTERELRRMGQTIRQLLDFSRAEVVRSVPTDLAAVAADAMELVRFHSALRHIAVVCEGVAPPAFADPDRVRQVLVNLLINAGQALGGTGAVRVTVREADAATVAEGRAPAVGMVGLQVADDGPGVPAHLVPQLFEPFFTTRAAGEGTGLGLAIAARIAGEAGGSISYGPGLPNAQGGHGAGFALWLPAAAVAGSTPVA